MGDALAQLLLVAVALQGAGRAGSIAGWRPLGPCQLGLHKLRMPVCRAEKTPNLKPARAEEKTQVGMQNGLVGDEAESCRYA